VTARKIMRPLALLAMLLGDAKSSAWTLTGDIKEV
jgi:hypothetical protein